MFSSSLWDEKFLSKNDIGWKFPSANGGEEEGFNNAEINSFKGGLDSLTREVIQNSLDAAISPRKPVVVEFSLIQLPIKDAFPYRDEYIKRVKCCADSSSIRTEEIVNTAITTLNSNDLFTLKISDYNTTGLTNPLGRTAKDSSFYSLLKGSGVSAKGEGAGGSYGLGKIAPILCSGVRSVFYYSQDINGDTGFQGKSMLASHRWNDDDGEGEYLTRRVGYFGHKNKFSEPLTNRECKHLPDFLTERKEAGTDIFVLGISPEATEDWSAVIKFSILSNFFIAISNGTLACIVKEPDGTKTEINASTLDGEFSNFEREIANLESHSNGVGDPAKDPLRYYTAYKNGNVICADESSKIAGSELYILPMKDLPPYLYPRNINTNRTRILYSRKSGMRIYERQRNSFMPSVIVYIGKGNHINSVLQSCEPAAHDFWDYKNIIGDTRKTPQKREARDCLDEIQKWITQCLSSLLPDTKDNFDVAGLGDQLPMSPETTDTPVQVEMHEKSASKSSPFSFSKLGAQDEDGQEGLSAAKLIRKDKKEIKIQEESQVGTIPATVSSDGEVGQMPSPDGTNNSSGGTPKMDKSGDPLTEDPDGIGNVPRRKSQKKHPKSKARKDIEFTGFRCISASNDGKYLLTFIPESDVSDGKLYISIIGDTESEYAEISSASLVNAPLGTSAKSKTKYVSLKNIASNTKVKMEVELKYKERSSLSISIEGSDDE